MEFGKLMRRAVLGAAVVVALCGCGRSAKGATEMRYVKAISSPERVLEFEYDAQNVLSTVRESADGRTDVYTYMRMGNVTHIKLNGDYKAEIRPDGETHVRVETVYGNMKVHEEFGLGTGGRLMASSNDANGMVYEYDWENGNLVRARNDFGECNYGYEDDERALTNVDIVNCISSLPHYPWIYCAYGWGQSEHLMRRAEDFVTSAEYEYELDGDGYITKVREKAHVNAEFEPYDMDRTYEVTYY